MFVPRKSMHVAEYQRQTCEMNVKNEKHADVNLGQNQFDFYKNKSRFLWKNRDKSRFLAQTHTQLSARKAPNNTQFSQGQSTAVLRWRCMFPSRWRCRARGKANFAHTQTPSSFPEIWGCPNKQVCMFILASSANCSISMHKTITIKKPHYKNYKNINMFGTPCCRQFTAAQGGPGTPDSREKLSVQLKW